MGYLNGFTGHPSGEGREVPGTTGARGPPGLGFNPTSNGNYDKEDKRLTQVGEGTDVGDAINKHQLVSTLSRSNTSHRTRLIWIKKLSLLFPLQSMLVNKPQKPSRLQVTCEASSTFTSGEFHHPST